MNLPLTLRCIFNVCYYSSFIMVRTVSLVRLYYVCTCICLGVKLIYHAPWSILVSVYQALFTRCRCGSCIFYFFFRLNQKLILNGAKILKGFSQLSKGWFTRRYKSQVSVGVPQNNAPSSTPTHTFSLLL